MAEQFISAAIKPIVGTFDAARMSTGEPGLPRQFRWRSQTIQIAQVLKTWRETGPCHHGSGESYVRKHWFEVLTDGGDRMKIYFERQPRSRRINSRWWLFIVDAAENKTASSNPVCVDSAIGSARGLAVCRFSLIPAGLAPAGTGRGFD